MLEENCKYPDVRVSALSLVYASGLLSLTSSHHPLFSSQPVYITAQPHPLPFHSHSKTGKGNLSEVTVYQIERKAKKPLRIPYLVLILLQFIVNKE